MTREEWLLKGTEVLRQRLFATVNSELPIVKVSVGFPVGSRSTGHNKITGQIWAATSTADGIAQIFISPQIDAALEALATLTHELVHACTPGDGHGSKFKALAHSIGLTGPMTSTVASQELQGKLEKLAVYLGPYPHAAINLADRRKQETRLLKMVCPEKSGYMLRITQKWLSVGAPLCPCHKLTMLRGD